MDRGLEFVVRLPANLHWEDLKGKTVDFRLVSSDGTKKVTGQGVFDVEQGGEPGTCYVWIKRRDQAAGPGEMFRLVQPQADKIGKGGPKDFHCYEW